MEYKFNDNIPIYLQLIEIIEKDIVSGKYQPKDKLPPVRELANNLGVNPNTVQRAYAELERMELVSVDRTNGRYVCEDKKKINKLLNELSNKYIDDLFENLGQLGLSQEKIKKKVSQWRNKQ